MTSKLTLADTIKKAIAGAMAANHTALICCVTSYDEATQTASLKSCMKFKYRDGDDIVAYDPPIMTNVPVVFPSSTIGGSVFSFVYPVSEGDEAVVIFNERSVDEWKTGGGSQYETQSNRRFDLSDGVAIVGLRSPSNPLDSDSYESDAAVLRGPKIIVRSDDIRLGSPSATDPVSLSSLTESELNDIAGKLNDLITWYNTNVALTIANAGVPTTAVTPASTTLQTSYSPGSVGATKVTAE